jgi:hypothetical protein
MGAQSCAADGKGFGACTCGATGGGSGGGGGAGVILCSDAQAPSCGAHGTCANTSSGAQCSCATGYSGLLCNQCATGFQDNAGTGTCKPTCAMANLTCSNHGTCSDTTGTAECACNAGYAGVACNACATGFQDNDANGSCLPACAASTCGVGGTCADASGTSTCTCTTGYSGATCGACSTGFQDKDANGTCLASCTGTTCGGNGTCADSSGTATCTCATGYAGATCATCAVGYQDNDGNGTCLPTCATAALGCAARSACVDSTGTAVCVCLAGYSGGPCTWSGVVRDPGFQNTPANAWTSSGVYQLVPADPGALDPGVVRAGSMSSAGTVIRQTISMPPSSTPDHFALELSAHAERLGATPEPMGLARVGSAIVAWATLPGPYVTSTACLGEGAFGGNRDLWLAPWLGSSFDQQHAIDHLDVVPTTACPALGVVTNGTFEDPTNAGWTFDQGSNASYVMAGAVNGSRALVVANATICDLPGAANTTISVPVSATLPSPALRFSTVGTAGTTLFVQSNNVHLREVALTGAVQVVTMCLPDWTQGSVVPLTFTLPTSTSTGGTCATADSRQAQLDNVSLVSDPTACPSSATPFNAGFEVGDLGASWVAWAGAVAISQTSPHTGTGALLLSVTKACTAADARQALLVPVRTAMAGPAIHFWYNPLALASNSVASARVLPWGFGPPPQGQLTLTGSGWTQATMCINSAFSGMPVELDFNLLDQSTGVPCGTTPVAPLAIAIDDVTVDVDPACPP